MTPDLMGLAMEGIKKTLTSGAYTLEKKYTFSDLTGKMVLYFILLQFNNYLSQLKKSDLLLNAINEISRSKRSHQKYLHVLFLFQIKTVQTFTDTLYIMLYGFIQHFLRNMHVLYGAFCILIRSRTSRNVALGCPLPRCPHLEYSRLVFNTKGIRLSWWFRIYNVFGWSSSDCQPSIRPWTVKQTF